MIKIKETLTRHPGRCAAVLAFLAAFGFFQFAYPYHLMRREQMNLFLYDWDYIRQTYRGVGWFARFVCDFADQFFHLPAVGPLLVALMLVAIAAAVYRIARHFLGRGASLVIAALFYAWSFLRETGNLYSTQYTLVVLGYLSLLLAALQFRKTWSKVLAATAFLAIGAWALGAPMHKDYGRLWDTPRFQYDKIIGLDTEIARERWDKAIKLSEKDLYMTEASYCFNLAHAMKGDLGEVLFEHSQNGTSGLLIMISPDISLFSNCLAGEAWYHLGNMTIAEQSAIIALQAAPKHTGTRFIERLARVNLISGEYGAAQKYLDMLGKTLFYGKWAKEMLAHIQDGTTPDWVAGARTNLSRTDFVNNNNRFRPVLLNLLEANPTNALAREYLLCYDLLAYHLDDFVEDYSKAISDEHLYQEAMLIWLSQHDEMKRDNFVHYRISASLVEKMQVFFDYPERYRTSYWYYYMNALMKSEQ